MANSILTELQTDASFTITLGSLASGSARQSDFISNASPARPAALVYVIIQSGGSNPTAGSVYEIYLLRENKGTSPTYRTDGAGATDAAITIVNAQLLGTITATANANTLFYGDFDTAPLGPLGPGWAIAVKNQSGQTMNASGHVADYVYYNPQVQ